MTEATCKTCPNWSDEDCRADVLKQYTPADHWCGKHPIRVAAYEVAVSLARLERLKTGPLTQVFGVGFIEQALRMQYQKTPWTDGETVGDWLKRDAAAGETVREFSIGDFVRPNGSPPDALPWRIVKFVGDGVVKWESPDYLGGMQRGFHDVRDLVLVRKGDAP